MRATRTVSAAALAILFFATTTSAVSLDPRGFGQALVYPYYTVNKRQDTLVSIVNAGDTGKLVQMRFREGYNGRVALQFLLFLSAHDVWTASLSAIADDDGALLKTSDTSCTQPAIPSGGVALRSADYDGTAVPADSGPQGIARTREGFFEFIAAGDIVAGSRTDAAITHVDGVPADCEDALASYSSDLVVPTGTLHGSAAIVDVGEGTFFPYTADAIAGFTRTVLDPGRDGGYPIGVTLALANSDERFTVATAYVVDDRGVPAPIDYPAGIDAVSAVFMADALYNEYVVAQSLGANTDWVVTLPTKSYYTDPVYGSEVPAAPFESTFIDGVSPAAVSGTVHDREEGRLDFGACEGICPPPFPTASLSYVVNVLPVDNAVTQALVSRVFGSTLTPFAIPPYGDDGAIVLRLDDPAHRLPGGIAASGDAVTLVGLPVTGFMAYNVINTNAQPGLLANYSGLFHHRSTTACIGGCASGNGE